MALQTVYDMDYKSEVNINDPTLSFAKVAEYYRENKLYKWDDSIQFVNTDIISKAARHFQKYARYNDIDPKRNPREWKLWWDREEYRRKRGITLPVVCDKSGANSDKDLKNIWIPGKMYGHLNYGPISITKDPDDVKLAQKDAIKNSIEISEALNNEAKLELLFKELVVHEKGETDVDFPNFWDGHYHFWIAQEFADKIGLDIIVFKARRKGFSYVGAWDSFDEYDLYPGVNIILIAYEDKYLTKKDKLFFMVKEYANHVNKHTDWNKTKLKDTSNEIIAGFKQDGGLTSGFKSSVLALSAKDNPDVARGIKAKKIKWEECFAMDTKVLMYDLNIKNIQDIEIGDKVMGHDGTPRNVLSTCSGKDVMYEIKQAKGDTYVVNSQHKLVLEQHCNTDFYKDDGEKIYTPTEFNNLKIVRKRATYGIKSNGLQLEEQKLPLEPYWLGLWLGDGDKYKPSIVVNIEKDIEIVDYLKDYALRLDTNLIEYNVNTTDKCRNYILRDKPNVQNRFNDFLKLLDVHKDKHIPYWYKISSLNQRLELLAGILDSDGYLSKGSASNSYRYDIAFTNLELAYDVVYLAQSCGFQVSATSSDFKNGSNNISRKHRIAIRGDLYKIPVKLPRRRPTDWIATSNPLNTKIEIKECGYGDYYGITIDGDHKFLLSDFTIVHNCGTFPNLSATVESTSSGAETGGYKVGQSTYWATIGSDESDYEDFARYFYKPMSLNCLPFNNLFDTGKKGTACGFFFSHLLNYEGAIDKHGNSDFDRAIIIHDKKRALAKEFKSTVDFEKWDAERVTEPSKALFRKSNNIFSSYAKIFNDNIDKIDRDPLFTNLGRCGVYSKVGDKVKFVSNEELKTLGQEIHPPINDHPGSLDDNYDMHGCVVEYFTPFTIKEETVGGKFNFVVPPGLYGIWHDPYATDKDGEGGEVSMKDSLGVAYVYERVNNFTPEKGGRIVASLIGRPNTTDAYNEQLLCLAIRYNTIDSLAFENDRGDVYTYFKHHKSLRYLMEEPELLSLREGSGRTGRKFGISIAKHLSRKSEAARMFKDMLGWVVSKDNETKEETIFAQCIPCKLLNRQLLMWKSKGNFDGVSACLVGALSEKEAIDRNLIDNAVAAIGNDSGDDFWEREYF